MKKPLYIESFLGRDKQHYIRIRGSNGRILLTSEGYRRKVNPVKLMDRLLNAVATGKLILRAK